MTVDVDSLRPISRKRISLSGHQHRVTMVAIAAAMFWLDPILR